MKVPSSHLKIAVYALVVMCAAQPRMIAQAPGVPEQALEIHPIGPDMLLEWESVVGRTYFLQVSGGLAPPGTGPALLNWAWADVIEEGHGGIISYEFGGNAPHGFARLHYTDEPRPPGVSLEAWDLDGDGRSNAQEIRGIPQSNPLLYSSSGTGISDGWAVAHGLDPNDSSIGGAQFQQSGLTNLEAQQAGVQAHPDATLTNFDGDGLENHEDADRHNRMIDWERGANPAFVAIEFDVENVEELSLDDFTDSGTALFTRTPVGEPSKRIVIDSEHVAHTFVHGFSSEEGDFGGYGYILLGEKVPGFRLVGETHQECLWDPIDNSFAPWQSPTNYHDALLDERGGLLIGWNWGNFPAGPGLRRSPNGALLPEDEILDSNHARIEGNGNVLSNKAYWRKGPLIGPPSPFEYDLQQPVVLPESWWVASATLEQSGAAGPQKWNIVAGPAGVMVSKNQGAFVKAGGSLADRFAYGATRQGWIVEHAFDQIWANGEWHDLKDCLGDSQIVEATGMGILDTGLAIARIRRATGPLKLAMLVPVDKAPEVLAVNSDFDEGRIDPATGYAIPDCDDMPGVDPRTGAGNTKLELGALQNHLDGIFTQGQNIVDDLHEGWLGVNPQTFDDEFWDGAHVTICKIEKDDDETGHPESGQVRFYAKWGEGPSQYRGIPAYDLATLLPVDLVTGGINGAAEESVYGSKSIIPEGAKFYIEGVRPGKITLEWRYQRGDIHVKYVQTFLVETRKSPDEWKQDLAYKIRLDTSNDPSGQIDVMVPPSSVPSSQWGTEAGYWIRMERLSECYDYYQENFVTDQAYEWCGLARLAGSQVVAGISDAHLSEPGSLNLNINVGIAQKLFVGGNDIFDSIGWQFHAYRSSSFGALKWTDENYLDRDLRNILEAWSILHQGVIFGDPVNFSLAAYQMTEFEQNDIIVPTWESIQTTWGSAVTNLFSNLAINIMDPHGDTFQQAVPGGNLSNTADRWQWIDDGSESGNGSPNGIIGAWKSRSVAQQLTLVRRTLRIDSQRFTVYSNLLPSVNDHLDQP